MPDVNILWIDDEIDLLKAHIIFLEQQGYTVFTANNAKDGYDMIRQNAIDLILLDESMPGMSGIEILPQIKRDFPSVPVIMVTKRDEEEVMDEALGSKVDGYLIKPVNPKQIILAIKQNTEQKQIIENKAVRDYQADFRQLSNDILFANEFNEWVKIYNDIVHWDIELEQTHDQSIKEILYEQKTEANINFAKFVEKNYVSWINDDEEAPPLVHRMLEERIKPELDKGHRILLIVIDNFRFDQWKTLKKFFTKYLCVKKEELIMTILPSVTQYARNAFFAGMLPEKIAKLYPDLWTDEEDEGNKNDFEFQLLKEFFKRYGKGYKISFHKIFNEEFAGKKLQDVKQFNNFDLNVLIFNFVDILAHAKTNMQMIKDLAKNETSYRNLVSVWFKGSYLEYLLLNIDKIDAKVFLTTDHGSIMVRNPVKVVGDRYSSTNIRYKQGKELAYKGKQVFVIDKPSEVGLPSPNVSTKYIFAKNYDYLVYPKNYNYYVKYFKNTFQHGGISMEEMLIPFIELEKK